MNLQHSQWKFYLVLGIGALVALALCVQCVRTFFYTESVLIPQQAEHEAARQVGAVSAAARSAEITDPRKLGPVLEHAMESASDRVLWMRVLDLNSTVFAQAGSPEGGVKFPAHWWNRVEQHDRLGALVDTRQGKALVVMLPFRMPPPPHFSGAESARPDLHNRLPIDHHAAYVIELAIPLKAVASAFDGLRENLIVGLIAAIALLVSLAIIALRSRHYLRGQYLESELRLARRVQSDLQPSAHSISPHLEFAAAAVAADHVGGDFYDVFEAESGKIAIVLGDASGKGVPAALLVSVLQGAIRSSTPSQHESACERINRMLCERTACERFATLFWGVFDPAAGTFHYVNAGHAAPMLVRRQNVIQRLSEGGPVLGLLPDARYSVGMIKVEQSDSLVLYSDGISEATGKNEQEFGEDRIQEIVAGCTRSAASEICERIMNGVNTFASAEAPADDRTLMVVRFLPAETAAYASQDVVEEAVA